jgi:hypothetical protein
VDRHSFDANPDFSDPNFHSDADPDPHPDPTSSFTQVENPKFFLLLFVQCQFTATIAKVFLNH